MGVVWARRLAERSVAVDERRGDLEHWLAPGTDEWGARLGAEAASPHPGGRPGWGTPDGWRLPGRICWGEEVGPELRGRSAEANRGCRAGVLLGAVLLSLPCGAH